MVSSHSRPLEKSSMRKPSAPHGSVFSVARPHNYSQPNNVFSKEAAEAAVSDLEDDIPSCHSLAGCHCSGQASAVCKQAVSSKWANRL